jgi:hypothetical protein
VENPAGKPKGQGQPAALYEVFAVQVFSETLPPFMCSCSASVIVRALCRNAQTHGSKSLILLGILPHYTNLHSRQLTFRTLDVDCGGKPKSSTCSLELRKEEQQSSGSHSAS